MVIENVPAKHENLICLWLEGRQVSKAWRQFIEERFARDFLPSTSIDWVIKDPAIFALQGSSCLDTHWIRTSFKGFSQDKDISFFKTVQEDSAYEICMVGARMESAPYLKACATKGSGLHKRITCPKIKDSGLHKWVTCPKVDQFGNDDIGVPWKEFLTLGFLKDRLALRYSARFPPTR